MQFSHKTKATEDTAEEAEDTVAFNELENELGEDETTETAEDEDVKEDIDLSVAESDAAIIDAVAAEAGKEFGLPTLTRAKVNLSKFAVMKVNTYNFIGRMLLTNVLFYQLRNLAKRMFNSPTIRADLESACIKGKIKTLLMVWDVAT